MTTEEKSPSKINSKIYVLIIQILFGIIIGISFTDYHNELVPFQFNFETAMIGIAFTTVVMSLIGYSIVIKNRYHKNFLRFILDVLLLYLYYQLVYSLQNSFEYFLWIFPLIFSVYLIWQILEYLEWKNDKKTPYKRKEFTIIFVSTILFTTAFFLIALLYDGSATVQDRIDSDDILNYWPVTNSEIIILSVLSGLIIGFRAFFFIIYNKINFE